MTPTTRWLVALAGSLAGLASWTHPVDPIGVAAHAEAAATVTPHPSRRFAYALEPNRDDIRRFAVAPGGALTALGTTPAGAAPGAMAIAPSGRFAYVVNQDSNDVLGFRVDPYTGALSPLGPRLEVGLRPADIAIDPSGRFAFVVNHGSNDVAALRIDDRSGMPAEYCDRTPVGAGPAALAVHPSGRFLVTVDADSGSLSVLAIDPAVGCLRAAGPPLALPSPRAIAFDVTGREARVRLAAPGGEAVFEVDARRAELRPTGPAPVAQTSRASSRG